MPGKHERTLISETPYWSAFQTYMKRKDVTPSLGEYWLVQADGKERICWYGEQGWYQLALLSDIINEAPDHNELCVQQTQQLIQDAYYLDMFRPEELWDISDTFKTDQRRILEERYTLSVTDEGNIESMQRTRIQEILLSYVTGSAIREVYFDSDAYKYPEFQRILSLYPDGALSAVINKYIDNLAEPEAEKELLKKQARARKLL